MKKYLVTFGLGTFLKGKCVVIEGNDDMEIRNYIFRKYGSENVSAFRDYENGKELIEKYNWEVIKEQI